MIELENQGILNWRRWSIVRKAQVLGALAGLVVTIVMVVLSVLVSPREPGDLITALLVLVCLPSSKLSQAIGWNLNLYTGQHLSVITLCLMVVTNSSLLFLVGGLIGWIVGKLKKPQREI